MKTVRVQNGIVVEIVPEAATVPSVEHWYGAAFAAECVEAADEVEQGWSYDGAAGMFSVPAEPEAPGEPAPTAEERLSALETENSALRDTVDALVLAALEAGK